MNNPSPTGHFGPGPANRTPDETVRLNHPRDLLTAVISSRLAYVLYVRQGLWWCPALPGGRGYLRSRPARRRGWRGNAGSAGSAARGAGGVVDGAR